MPESAGQKLMSKTQCKIVPRRKSMISEPARAQCANERHTFPLFARPLVSLMGTFLGVPSACRRVRRLSRKMDRGTTQRTARLGGSMPLGSEHSPRLIRDLHSLSTAQPAGLLQHRANEGRRGRGFGWLHDLFEPYYLAHLFWH